MNEDTKQQEQKGNDYFDLAIEYYPKHINTAKNYK